MTMNLSFKLNHVNMTNKAQLLNYVPLKGNQILI